jgi:hypothetical protein
MLAILINLGCQNLAEEHSCLSDIKGMDHSSIQESDPAFDQRRTSGHFEGFHILEPRSVSIDLTGKAFRKFDLAVIQDTHSEDATFPDQVLGAGMFAEGDKDSGR